MQPQCDIPTFPRVVFLQMLPFGRDPVVPQVSPALGWAGIGHEDCVALDAVCIASQEIGKPEQACILVSPLPLVLFFSPL